MWTVEGSAGSGLAVAYAKVTSLGLSTFTRNLKSKNRRWRFGPPVQLQVIPEPLCQAALELVGSSLNFPPLTCLVAEFRKNWPTSLWIRRRTAGERARRG